MKKIILDCDPGMDDSMAIIMAAKAPQLELLAEMEQVSVANVL